MLATAWALEELGVSDPFAMPLDAFPSAMGADAEDSADLAFDMAARESEQALADAYARGRADGERLVRQHAEATLATAMSALQAAIESVRLHEARWTSNAEENIAALAVTVARHLVQREVDADPTIVRELVQRALTQFPIDQVIHVRLHPDDLGACGDLVTPDSAGRVREVRWAADPHIVRGGCLVEGRERIIDGRVDTSLERAYRTIGQVQA
jgi:flagellar assembly protein FliH